MISTFYWGSAKQAAVLAALLCFPLWSQLPGSGHLRVEPPARLVVKAGETAAHKLQCRLASGYHTNSNAPSDPYLIPLRLAWEAAPLDVVGIGYPKGQLEKYAFTEKPLSVYTGDFEIVTKFKVPPNAPRGPRTITGKLRYQACNNSMCFPPKTVPVQLGVQIN